MKYSVKVRLKDEVLDPEGRAIGDTLNRVGYNDLLSIRVSKVYELDLQVSDRKSGYEKAKDIAKKYLVNPVAEQFWVESDSDLESSEGVKSEEG